MPAIQVIDQLNPTQYEGQNALLNTLDEFRARQVAEQDRQGLSRLYQKYQNDRANIDEAIFAAQTERGLSPTARINATNTLMALKKQNDATAIAIGKNLKYKALSEQDKLLQKRALLADGYPEWEADVFVNSSPGVQQQISRNHNDLKSRGLRQPGTTATNNTTMPGQPQNAQPQNAQPQNAQQTNTVPGATITEPNATDEIKNELPVDGSEWPEIPKPKGRTPAEQVRQEERNQKENNKYLADVRKKNGAIRGIGVRLNLLEKYSEKVEDGAGRLIIDPATGEPYPEASLAKLVNKETQAFVKTLNDFLSEAKDYFGGRVTNFDVQAFKSRLPSLLNTAQGRRLIIKQMKLINDLESAHTKIEEEALKHYGKNASYSDIVKVADEKAAVNEENIINKINVLVEASDKMDQMAKNPKKYAGTTLMQDDKGKFRAVKNELIDQKKALGWQVY